MSRQSEDPSVQAAVAGLSRRTVLKGSAGALALGSLPALLAACSRSSSTNSGSVSGKVSVGSNYSDASVKKAFAAVVSGYSHSSGISVNTVDHDTFQNDISNYLQGTPNDVFTWFSGNRAKYFAKQGLLEPIDDVWDSIGANFTDAVKAASKGADGKYYLVPWINYPWVMFYKTSVFKKHGYTVPATFDDLLSLCAQMKKDGFASPIAIGQKDGWPAMGTFDIINMRLNGYQFHVDLMSHKHSWTDPKVLNVFKTWQRMTPYYTPGGTGRIWEDAVNIFDANKESAMIFQGTDQVGPQVSKSGLADLDFFPFPQIVPDYPTDSAIDAPIDGFLMSAKVKNRKGAAAFMEYLGSAAAERTYLKSDPSDIGTATNYPANTYTPLQKKSVQIITNTKNLAQFLDRDTLPNFAYPDVQSAMNAFLNDPSSYASICSKLEQQAKSVFV